jgi:hypothetical protein
MSYRLPLSTTDPAPYGTDAASTARTALTVR